MPELLLRLLVADVADVAVDVVVAVEECHTVAELAAAIAGHLGLVGVPAIASVRLGRLLDPRELVGRVDLLTGDELRIGAACAVRPAERAGTPDDTAADTAIDLIAGPESGRSQLVRRPGRYVVGRSRDAAVRVDDPSVSRHHLTVELQGDGAVTVHPQPFAANGVLVNGVEITAPAAICPTDVVTLGGTRLAVRPIPHRISRQTERQTGRQTERQTERQTDRWPGRLGRIDFHRTPYRPPVVSAHPSEPIGPIPERPEPRRLPTIAVLAPLVAGLVLFAFTRQLQFLALMLLSPVVMVGTVVEERRSGRRTLRERVARFRRELVEHRRRLERLRDAERVDRFRASPDLTELIRRAELRTVDLWARGRAAPDFLSLRLGLGPATVGFMIELERGGADDLRDEAMAALDGLDELVDVPVAVTLVGVFAMHGETALVDGVAASLVVQAATLHSPEDLVIAGALAPGGGLDWLRWLPHARSVTSPLSGDHVAHTRADADRLLDRLLEVAERRLASAVGAAGVTMQSLVSWPRVLVVLDGALTPDPARVARLLDLAPAAGVAVVWMASTADEVPRQASRTLVVRRTSAEIMRGRLWSTDPTVADVELEIEHVRPERAARAARSLAPIRDASTVSLAAAIPRTVPLFDVLGVGRPTASWIVEHWHQRPEGGLRFPVGLGADGPVELDLVEDGPHTLVGGTSGAGKSELLQTMVASLAAHHPSTRLNFLFVDYKGGAASQVFERLPHTVGYVTNLSVDLATRALVSLRAELHRRMSLLEGRAKDLDELRRLAPDTAPPSLVIVVDEFATLVREVPEFVTGIVDIAQRGRSLGIHLVLATQRPTGAVNENILANTNLRISLRMLDRAESAAVIGVPDAADIPVPLRGRGLVRLGPRQLVEFQSAFAGAPLAADEVRPPVLVGRFATTDGSPVAAPSGGPSGGSQLDAVLDAIVAAERRLDLPAPRRPWRDVLPETVALDDVLRDPAAQRAVEAPGRFVAIGLVDAPERQEQHAAVVDLEAGGGLLVFGSGGAGSTTLLRTIAASVGASVGERVDGVAVVVFDGAGRGCAGLRALGPVVDLASGDDLEAVTRLLLQLERELDRRRRGADPAKGNGEFGDTVLPRIVVLVDGFGALTGALLDAAAFGDEWVERIVRLVVEGRQVGIHTVLTADRRSSVPARIHAAIANRVVLRHADDAGYADHGIRAERARGLTPGRGWWFTLGQPDPALVQIASTPPGTATHIETVRWRRHHSLASEPLPDHDRSCPTPPGGLAVAIGTADVTGASAVVDLDWSHLAVYGPPRSGRSTALASIAIQLAGAASDVTSGGGHEIILGGPASSPLRELGQLPGVRAAFGRDVGAMLHGLTAASATPRVLVLDDLDGLDDPSLVSAFERLARDEMLRLVAALEPRTGFTTNPLVGLARRARRVLVLQPDDPAEFLQLTGIRLALRPGLRMPPGRGVLLVDRQPTVVQVADALSVVATRPRP